MHRRFIACGSLGIFALLCAVAIAQENQERSGPSSPPAPPYPEGSRDSSMASQAQRFINDWDENGDGSLEKNELPRRMRDQFSRLDRDGNNKLSRRELEQHGRTVRQQRPVAPIEFVYIWVSDADRGHLSLDELQRAYDTLQKIDKDGNGELARDELEACRKANLDKWAKMVVNRLDENDDDKISEDEAQDTFLTGRFQEFDQNDDGMIDRNELRQCAAKQQQHQEEESASKNRDTRTGRRQGGDQDESGQKDRD